jgi:hypothetical protein
MNKKGYTKNLRKIREMLDLRSFAEGQSCFVLGLEEAREVKVIGYT